MRSSAEYRAARQLALTPVPLCEPPSACHCCEAARDLVGALLPNGSFALGSSDGEVRIYAPASPRGAPVRMIGHRGTDSAAYRAVRAIRWWGAGQLAVLDLAALQVLRFDTLGALRGRERITARPAVAGVRLGASGALLLTLTPGDSVGGPTTGTLLLQPTGSRGLREVATVPAVAQVARGTDLQPLPPFFLPVPSWDVATTGQVYYAAGQDDRVLRIDLMTGRRETLRLGIPAQRVDRDMVRAESTRVLATFSESWRAHGERVVGRLAQHAPRTLPVVTALLVGQDVSLWVREGAAATRDSVRWNVFDGSAQWRGWVALPRGARILDASQEYLLTSEARSDSPNGRLRGTEHVVLYRR